MAGEIAMQIVHGEVCQLCTQFLTGGAVGFPRLCTECGGDAVLLDALDEEEDDDVDWNDDESLDEDQVEEWEEEDWSWLDDDD